MLTSCIFSAADVTQLLLVLGQHEQQLDCIHVSAAVKQACRTLRIRLAVPQDAAAGDGQQQTPQAQLQWMRQLQLQDVQLRLQQLQQQQQQQRTLEHRRQQQEVAEDLHTSNTQQQQQQHLQWVLDQQLAPHALVQQQLQQHMAVKQQQQPDDWLLLLQLCQLVVHHAPSMASQQLCTCLNGLCHLLLTQPGLPLLGLQPYRSALQQLLQASAQQLQSFDHRGLSVLLHAAAAVARAPLGLAPSAGFMKRWYRRSRAVMQQASPLDLAMAGWALGRLGAYPPSQWTAEFLVQSKVSWCRSCLGLLFKHCWAEAVNIYAQGT
jgi:hypothetical protein